MAQQALIRQLKSDNKLFPQVGAARDFGDIPSGTGLTPHAMKDVDKSQIQYRSHHQKPVTAPMDDLTAALANFNFQAIVKGQVKCVELLKPAPKARYEVTITQVGIYVKDSYDFNDSGWPSQPLGFWHCVDNYVGKNPFGSYYVTNESFRQWRDQHGQGNGGDYLVFSDIVIIAVNDKFQFEA